MKKQNLKIIFYGAPWCPDCRMSKQFLDQNQIEYEYINIEENPEMTKVVEKINNGLRSIPTIIFPNEEILVEPDNNELEEALIRNGYKLS
ncbi:MAG: glutaredoxin family protein [Microgenomates group bacterium]